MRPKSTSFSTHGAHGLSFTANRFAGKIALPPLVSRDARVPRSALPDMSIAPEPILRAGNDTVAWACIFCRNQTLREDAPVKMLNDAMEAIHEIPRMLVDWDQ